MIGIYKITNVVNGKVYIGQSINIEQRWKSHRTTPFQKNADNYESPLYRAIRKYGLNNFTFEVIEECKAEELNSKEVFYIAQYNAYGCGGYNQNEGGNSSAHSKKLTDDDVNQIIKRLKTSLDNTQTIAKDFGVGYRLISNINNGKSYYREDEIYPIRPKLMNLYLVDVNQYARKPTNYTCTICGQPIKTKSIFCIDCGHATQKRTKRPSPLELARLITEKGFEQTGRIFGVSGNALVRWCKDYNIPYHKKELSQWYNEQIGVPTLIQPIVKKRTLRKAVKQIDIKTGEVLNAFHSQTEAARIFGAKSGSHIGDVCVGKRKTAYGYLWQYINN